MVTVLVNAAHHFIRRYLINSGPCCLRVSLLLNAEEVCGHVWEKAASQHYQSVLST